MVLILGCGDVGFTVITEMKNRGVEVKIVDRDPKRVEQLKQMGYKAISGDFENTQVLKDAGLAQANLVFIMVSDFSAVHGALKTIKKLKTELKIHPVVVVRVADEAEVDEAKRLGASDALPSSQLLAKFTVNRFETIGTMSKEKRLRSLVNEFIGSRMAIVLQTNPDPDSIASGVALKRYAKAFGLDADLIYDGVVGYRQNRALVNTLELELLEADDVDFTRYTCFALVDVATHANCALPKRLLPTIVIDHHSVPSGEVNARYHDISLVGANSTVMTNYLRNAGVEVDGPTAAALIVGILTDTMSFTRGAKPPDFEAYEYLMELVDVDLLAGLMWPTISADALNVLMTAIKSSKIKGSYLLANVGEVNDRDLIAQTADFMIKREGIATTFIYGVCGDVVRASARTKDVSLHIGQTLRTAFGKIGAAGGHSKMAGATIPLEFFGVSKKNRRMKIDQVVGRGFLETLGIVKPRKTR